MRECNLAIVAILVAPLFLISCGPSASEKKRIAQVACAEIIETRNMDSAIRVRIVNDAREKMGLAPYLEGDDEIRISVMNSKCEDLVLDSRNWYRWREGLQEEIKRSEEAKKRSEEEYGKRRAEEARIASLPIAEQECQKAKLNIKRLKDIGFTEDSQSFLDALQRMKELCDE